MKMLINYLIPAGAMLFLLYLVQLQMFWNALSKYEPKVWLSLGSPHIIKNNAISNLSKNIKYFLSKRYRESNARKVCKYGDRVRVLFYTCMSYILIMFPMVVMHEFYSNN